MTVSRTGSTLRLRIALSVDWVCHTLRLPGAIQFHLCQWVGRETLAAEPDEPAGAGRDPFGRPDPILHPEFWTE